MVAEFKIHPDALTHLINGDHGSPYDVLGAHAGEQANEVSVRAFQPGVERMAVVNESSGERTDMHRVHDDGFFEVTFSYTGTLPELRYHYEAHTKRGEDISFHDA